MVKESQIFIRPVELSDALEVLKWENDVENWSSSINDSPFMLWDIVRLIEDLADVQKTKQARWIICDKKTDKLIGAVDLCEIDFEKGEAIIGVIVAEKQDRNKGIAFESLQLLEFEATKLGVKRLTCAIHPENKASLRLFEKLGFQKFGQTDDKYHCNGVYIEALLFEKWLKK